jgi:hypothetical protein
MRPALFLLVAPVMLACNGLGNQNGVAMQDTFALDLFGPPQDAINTPYVAGAKFDVNVVANGVDTTGFRVTSSDPTVLRIDRVSSSTSSLDFPAIAAGVGHATLSIVDAKGNVVHSHDVDVDEPDGVELHSHGLMLGGLPDAQTKLSHVNVLESGTATLLVRYFKGSQELWGNGAVTASSVGAVDARTTRSSFGDARDWIEIDASQLGSGQVTLSVGGSAVAVVPVSVVDAGSVARVGMLAQSDSQAQDGQSLAVFARASNAQGDDVYGASFTWQINGAAIAPSATMGYGRPADLLTYQYKGSQSETVSASIDGDSSSLSVHGQGGTIGSSADVGCSVARGAGAAGGGGVFALALGAVVAAAARRRRAARTA